MEKNLILMRNILTTVGKVHHKAVLKCNKCGKQFVSEKERLHHVQARCKDKKD